MQLRKVILSIVLLLSYSLGMAHDVLPHYHANDLHSDIAVGIKLHHHHSHHEHDPVEQPEHDHVTHEDHLDDGLLDYVICLLSEFDHESDDSEHLFYYPSNPEKINLKPVAKVKQALVLLSVLTAPAGDIQFTGSTSEFTSVYEPPILSGIPLRGPPAFTC